MIEKGNRRGLERIYGVGNGIITRVGIGGIGNGLNVMIYVVLKYGKVDGIRGLGR